MDFLRPYQKLAADSILKEWETKQSTMVVLPTGAGKTCLFAAVIHNRLPGRALVLAHREELIFQAKDKIEKFTGLDCEIEMGELTASKSFWSTMPVVIATVQTLVSGRVRPRMEKFNPADFSTIVIDEFHHATANTYVKILDYFKSNPDINVPELFSELARKPPAMSPLYTLCLFFYKIRLSQN
jgi:superfamily II DNA or RNA helicase